MKKIPLTRGYYALVDDTDFPVLSQFKWQVKISKSGCAYARRGVTKGARVISEYMHHYIMGKVRVDHRDGDGLNNLRRNLRPATHQQNLSAFRRPPEGKTSRYRGVRWHKASKAWNARIKVNQKTLHLGCFSNEEEAARAYDRAAIAHFGEFASLNFNH